MKALKVTLKYVLSRTLRGEEPTLSYSNLFTLLAMVVNVVNGQPVTLWALADYFAPFTVNQMLLGRTPGAAAEDHDDLDKQCFGASN